MTSRRLLERDPSLLTEAEFSGLVVDLARLGGWKRFHPFDSRRSTYGWPDWTFVKGSRLVFAELKSETGKVTARQQEWLDALRAVGEAIARATTVVTVHSDGEAQVMDLLMKSPDARQRIARELNAPGVEVYVWRPSDWPEVVEVLTGKRQREVAA